MRSFKAAVLACLLLMTAGCGASYVSPSQGLRLTVTISQSTINAGGTATLTLRLENTSDQQRTLTFNSGCQVMPYITRRDTGEVVYPGSGGWVCAAVITQLELMPFATVVKEVQVKADPGAPQPQVGLPAGEYLAHAKLEQPQVLQSESVAFTVR